MNIYNFQSKQNAQINLRGVIVYVHLQTHEFQQRRVEIALATLHNFIFIAFVSARRIAHAFINCA